MTLEMILAAIQAEPAVLDAIIVILQAIQKLQSTKAATPTV
jgi:hypothetical protein